MISVLVYPAGIVYAILNPDASAHAITAVAMGVATFIDIAHVIVALVFSSSGGR